MVGVANSEAEHSSDTAGQKKKFNLRLLRPYRLTRGLRSSEKYELSTVQPSKGLLAKEVAEVCTEPGERGTSPKSVVIKEGV